MSSNVYSNIFETSSETLAAIEIDLHLPEELSSEDEEGCKDG